MADDTRRLRVALKANAWFSGLCGLALMIMPGAWAELIGFPLPWALGALGFGLACFAALAAHAAADVLARRTIITLIIGADVLWVASSPIAMVTGANTLTVSGQGVIAVVALLVAALAAAQWMGLRAMNRGTVAETW
jgi:NADH:ubiquinone oxidoreductase subunit K